ncbi:MAG: ergothioneine biosynthesis protein EgtB [Gemmatimonadota bacterium]|nr:ergothioneine biosynthesis protein EgtB [Gemmatimonadota bacterium]
MTAPATRAPAERAPGAESIRAELRRLLMAVRERTVLLTRSVTSEDAERQHDRLMSPMVWDLGHIAAFESLWLLENVRGEIRFGEMPGVYNPFEHPRRDRGSLELPSRDVLLDMMERTRAAVLDRLQETDVSLSAPPLLRDGYVYRMVAQHEAQHQETMLQTLQLKLGAPYVAPRMIELPPAAAPIGAEMVRFPGGAVTIGTTDRRAAYDNERPRHVVPFAPFWIDATPVTNGAFLGFVEAGGYDDQSYWCADGWRWRSETGVRAPKHWERTSSGWRTRTMDCERALDPMRPVCHVCYFEADAFARSAGKRLPTEAEWEAAAMWDPAEGRARAFPWGDDAPTTAHANLDQLAFDTAPVGAYAPNVSPIGCHGMIGDVWEWTSSDFGGYPGYESFPYPEYSEVFFGSEYKVLRGGSWATSPHVARATFRNWDYPIRRQIFSGFRCAKDDA